MGKLLDRLADWVWRGIDWHGFGDERTLQAHLLRHSGRPVLVTHEDGDGSGWRSQPTLRGLLSDIAQAMQEHKEVS